MLFVIAQIRADACDPRHTGIEVTDLAAEFGKTRGAGGCRSTPEVCPRPVLFDHLIRYGEEIWRDS